MINEFTNYLRRERKLSENTIESYKHDIVAFFRYLDIRKCEPLKVTTTVMLDYLTEQDKMGKKSTTITRSIASIRSFYNHMIDTGAMLVNPVSEIHSFKPPRKLPQILTNHEVNLLLDQPTGQDLKSLRDKAMLEVLYATGIRVSELVMLDLDDLDAESGFVICRSEGKDRAIPLHDDAKYALEQYLSKARELLLADKNEKALFVNINGKRLSRQGFWKIIKHYRDEAHIEKELTPHTLRHSFAAHLYENGAPLKSIQEMLGHQTITSTQIYATLTKHKIKEVYKNAHPRAR